MSTGADRSSAQRPTSGGPVRRIADGVDRFQQRHRFLGFPLAVRKKFSDDQARNLAALIAYYGFVPIFPLLLVLVTVLGIVLESTRFQTQSSPRPPTLPSESTTRQARPH